MSTLKTTIYTAYDFNEQDYFLATTYSDLQLQHLQTELSAAATERSTMVLNPANLMQSMGEMEYTRGKMDALQALLNTHQNTKDMLEAKIREELEANKQRD